MSVAPWVKAIKTFFLLFYAAMTVARYEIICELQCFSFCKQSKNIFFGLSPKKAGIKPPLF